MAASKWLIHATDCLLIGLTSITKIYVTSGRETSNILTSASTNGILRAFIRPTKGGCKFSHLLKPIAIMSWGKVKRSDLRTRKHEKSGFSKATCIPKYIKVHHWAHSNQRLANLTPKTTLLVWTHTLCIVLSMAWEYIGSGGGRLVRIKEECKKTKL